MAQSIDDFLVQVPSSLRGTSIEAETHRVNATLRSLNLPGQSVSFGGTGLSGIKTSSLADVGRGTTISLIDDQVSKRLGEQFGLDMSKVGGAFLSPQTAMLDSFYDALGSAGVETSRRSKGLILLGTGTITGSNKQKIMTPLHEIGHAVAWDSGVTGAAKDEAYKKYTEAFRRFSTIETSNKTALKKGFQDILEGYMGIAAEAGNEEGRAESFSVNLAKRIGLTPEKYTPEASKYFASQTFTHYTKEGEEGLFRFINPLYYDDNYSDVLKSLEGPISGKVGLTPEKLIQEVQEAARSQASGRIFWCS